MKNRRHSSSGFALLLAIIMVSVVVSIGISVLDVTIKQLALSTNSRDSENAFHASNAGVECMLYWRLTNAPELADGDPVAFSCFGSVRTAIPQSVSTSDGVAYRYNADISWPAGSPNRCSVMTALVIVASDTDSAVVSAAAMLAAVPGYPYGSDKTCPAGGICTILSSQGFSRPCPSGGGVPTTVGTLQREILLEL